MATINQTTGWQQRNTVTFDNSGAGVAQTDFVLYFSHKLGGNNLSNIIPYTFYKGINRAALDGRDIRPTSDSSGTTQIPFDLHTYNGNVESGSNTSTTALQLRDSAGTFTTTCKEGDRVFNEFTGNTALITSVDSATQITLNADIFPVADGTGKAYIIVRFYASTKVSIGTSTTPFYLWCGNSNATALAFTDTYGRNNVYNPTANPYLAHWLLNENTIGNAAVDSTGNGWNGTSGGTNKPSSIDGIFYQGQFFSGNNGTPAVEDRFNMEGTGASSSWEGGGTSPPTAFTLVHWFRASGSTGATQMLAGKRDNASPFKGYEIQIANSPKVITFALDMGNSRILLTGTTTLNTTSYYCLVITVPTSGVPTDFTMRLNGANEVSTYQMLDAAVDTGTTVSLSAGHLVDLTQNFLTTVQVNDIVLNTTAAPDTFARVTAVNSNTDLTLSADIIVANPTAYQIFRGSNINITENYGLGSRQGDASISPFEGSQEISMFINGVQMSNDWAISHYNNITSMSTLLVASANTTYNQFTTDWDLNYKAVCRTKPTYIQATLTNYISYINELQVAGTSFWSYVQNGGGNIVICTGADGTGRIPIDVSTCDTSTQKLSIYLKRTVTLGGGDYIYIFFKSTNTVYQPHWDNTNGRNETYSHKNFKGVWHLNEQGAGVAGEFKDSTGTGNDGQGTIAPTRVDAVLGKGQQGNGSTMKITLPSVGFMTGKQAGTMSGWAIFNGDTSEQTLFGYGTDSNGQRRVLQQRSDGFGGHTSNAYWGVTRLYSGKTHIAWVFPTDAGTLTINETLIYINGVQMLTSGTGDQQLKLLSGTNLTVNTVITYSQLLKGGGGVYASDTFDEMRITTDELASQWIALDYYNQLLTTNLWTGGELLNLVGNLAPAMKGGLQ